MIVRMIWQPNLPFARTVKILHAFGTWLSSGSRPLSSVQVSSTISVARISLIVGLVFLHYLQYPNVADSPFDGMDTGSHRLATFVNSFVLFFFFSAVPLLSMISGWLFFSFAHNEPVDAVSSIVRRIRRRLHTLYLPLVLWNSLALVALLGLFAIRPDHDLFAELNIWFGEAGVWDYVNAVLGITKRPIAFQFWFLRDLFVTVLLSPLLWLLLRRAPYLSLVLLGIVWLVGSNVLIFFRADVPFFFFLGGLIRMKRADLAIGLRPALALLAIYIVLVALRTSAPLLMEWTQQRPPLLTLATRAMRLVGVLACWGVLQHLAATRIGQGIGAYGGFAFFLYAAHFPLIAAVKIVLWRWLPAQTDGWMLVHYLASVLVTIGIALPAGLLLARWWPGQFALVNGGRNPNQPMSAVPERPASGTPARHRSDEGERQAS